mmetsp:Transcript_12678/g.27811  ORF Transcript_12678/g.27811 Transcript_12678/m.27811 type:complete len:219 (-) Transcript_12678:321-977(-)|eukprot:CAMPEP_0206492244 /NCGR_PEP_ID=MMETSP0324_2-20121206/45880_1 /ASSEMBLY_ACC=CAM_ASM_000836 /TAXON_ID=2866 /ORGANISM="Crypthecodinium cohnii, Strain Seligo" /LENGTH=218 /DNA_ID=CAMNT_0053974397 /DNA_START=72 /DNA_END=728 /DNA_ORIENTATION=+
MWSAICLFLQGLGVAAEAKQPATGSWQGSCVQHEFRKLDCMKPSGRSDLVFDVRGQGHRYWKLDKKMLLAQKVLMYSDCAGTFVAELHPCTDLPCGLPPSRVMQEQTIEGLTAFAGWAVHPCGATNPSPRCLRIVLACATSPPHLKVGSEPCTRRQREVLAGSESGQDCASPRAVGPEQSGSFPLPHPTSSHQGWWHRGDGSQPMGCLDAYSFGGWSA